MVTPETLTDEMIAAELDRLPRGHYSTQWYLDAIGPESPSHRGRRANARREVCAAINARSDREAEDAIGGPNSRNSVRCPHGNMPREAGAGHWREWHRGHGCHLDPDTKET